MHPVAENCPTKAAPPTPSWEVTGGTEEDGEAAAEPEDSTAEVTAGGACIEVLFWGGSARPQPGSKGTSTEV